MFNEFKKSMVSIEHMGTGCRDGVRIREETQSSFFLSWVDFIDNGQSRTMNNKMCGKAEAGLRSWTEHEEKLEENWGWWWVWIANNCLASFFLLWHGGKSSWNWRTKIKMSMNSVMGVCEERKVVLSSDSCFLPHEILLLRSHFIFTKVLWGNRGG